MLFAAADSGGKLARGLALVEERRDIAPPPAANESQTGGLTEPFRSQTGARDEALHLAFRNAFVVLDGSAEAAHRTFGCLYGGELYGGWTRAIVPSAVSTVSAGQKLFSALMIFCLAWRSAIC